MLAWAVGSLVEKMKLLSDARFLCVVTVNVLIKVRITTASEETFKQCMISNPQPPQLGYCVGVDVLSKLQNVDHEPDFDLVDGVTFSRDAQQYREGYNFIDSNPGSFRSIIESVQNVFSSRSLKWDMSFVHPGLLMRIAPSVDTSGQIEFILDQQQDSMWQHNIKEATTGGILARQFLVPMLLGFKLNAATLIPIFFAILIFVVKKAFVLSKVALIIGSAYALGSLLFSAQNVNQYQHYNYQTPPVFHYNRYPQSGYSDTYRKNIENVLTIQGRIPMQEDYAKEDKNNGRNFAWDDDELVKKL